MKVKLAQAQAILECLTVEDFDQIEKNATAMFLLTTAEQWNASKDAQFVQHSKEFERVTTKLAKYASEKNLEGASLMYVQLTLIRLAKTEHGVEQEVPQHARLLNRQATDGRLVLSDNSAIPQAELDRRTADLLVEFLDKNTLQPE